jgi:Dodecin
MTAQDADTARLGPPVARSAVPRIRPQLDLEGIFSGHARTGASGVSPNTCSCPSWLYVKDMSAEVDSGRIINYRISAKLTFKPE